MLAIVAILLTRLLPGATAGTPSVTMLVSFGRSGSTFVASLLGSHPALAMSAGEPFNPGTINPNLSQSPALFAKLCARLERSTRSLGIARVRASSSRRSARCPYRRTRAMKRPWRWWASRSLLSALGEREVAQPLCPAAASAWGYWFSRGLSGCLPAQRCGARIGRCHAYYLSDRGCGRRSSRDTARAREPASALHGIAKRGSWRESAPLPCWHRVYASRRAYAHSGDQLVPWPAAAQPHPAAALRVSVRRDATHGNFQSRDAAILQLPMASGPFGLAAALRDAERLHRHRHPRRCAHDQHASEQGQLGARRFVRVAASEAADKR
ncbi:hypothetical protein T492DRAFT_920185 [Pavlovales sp. CCMP2436]|nr:hypothetical protein T492DRAFT_920185 [Pavlovales sp. CCMP2436]